MLKLKDYPPAGEFYNILLDHYKVGVGWCAAQTLRVQCAAAHGTDWLH